MPSCFSRQKCGDACIQNRAHIHPPASKTALTSKTRSHPIKPPHRYCFTTTTTSTSHTLTSKTRSHPAMLPSNDPLIHHTTPCCSPFNHQTAVGNHRVDAIHNRAENREQSLVTDFPLVTPACFSFGQEEVEVVLREKRAVRGSTPRPRGESAVPIGREGKGTRRKWTWRGRERTCREWLVLGKQLCESFCAAKRVWIRDIELGGRAAGRSCEETELRRASFVVVESEVHVLERRT